MEFRLRLNIDFFKGAAAVVILLLAARGLGFGSGSTPTPTPVPTVTPTHTPVPSATPTDTPPTNTPPAAPTQAGCPQGCTLPKTGCAIKGNISYNSGEKIYHLPGQEYYQDTVIRAEQGERWFCTDAEALANGWRKALR